MKKRIFSFLLAVILCFGMAANVMATESPDAGEVTVLPVPTIEWCDWEGDSWYFQAEYMEGNSEYSLNYDIEIWNNGEPVTGWSIAYGENSENITWNVAEHIDESGNYQIKARSWKYDENNWPVYGEYGETSIRTYVRPENELGTTVGEWDSDRTGIFLFNGVEGASRYRCDLYRISGEYAYPSARRYVNLSSVSPDVPASDSAENVHEVDFTSSLRYEGEYYVVIKALSGSISTVANGAWGEQSAILDTTVESSEVEDVVGDANTYPDASEGLEHLVENTSKEDLEVAMQTNPDVRAAIAELEENYASQQNITVTPPEVVGDAANYVKADEIEIIGAALNAAAGNEVKLSVSMPKKEETVTGNYSKIVQLDLKVLCDNQSVTDLTIPVTITLPVPTGISTSNLRIFHYHNGDTQGRLVNYALSADGKYITFTVDGFSTFVFANEVVQNIPTNPGNNDIVTTSPKTDDYGMTFMAGVLAVLLVGVVMAKKRVY